MIRKIAIAAVAASVMLLSFGTGHATTYSARYVATGVANSGVVTGPNAAPNTVFPAGKTPTSITVVDSAGLTNFEVDVCQETADVQEICSGVSPTVVYCSTGAPKPLVNFDPSKKTYVFVNAIAATGHKEPDCTGHSVTGTITFVTS